MVRVISCGVYIPALRVSSSEIAKALGASSGAGIKKRALPEVDEDAFTMAVEAAKEALEGLRTPGGTGGLGTASPSGQTGAEAVKEDAEEIDTGAGLTAGPADVDYVALASTSLPYEEKSFGGALAECLGIPKTAFVSELGSSTRSGTEALIGAASALESGASRLALVVVSDCPRGGPRNPVEQAAGAGAVAFVLRGAAGGVYAGAFLEGAASGAGGYTGVEGDGESVPATFRDRAGEPDRSLFYLEESATWSQESLGIRSRRTGFAEASDLGIARHSRDAFVGTCAAAVRALLEKVRRANQGEGETGPDEAPLPPAGSVFQGLVVTQPDARLPLDLGKTLGFQDEKVLPGVIASDIGDAGAASCLLGLVAYLESGGLKPGDPLLLVSYGSGAVADALKVRVGRGAEGVSRRKPLRSLLSAGTDVDFVTYLRIRGWL